MDELVIKIDKYRYGSLKYTVVLGKKKEKNCVYIQDGFIKYKINLATLTCQCGTCYCSHILYMLFDIYKLSYNGVLYLSYVLEFFLNKLNEKNLSKLIGNEIDNYFKQDNCGYCQSNLIQPTNYLHFYICSQCKKALHSKCANICLKEHKKCIYCRKELNI